MTPEQLDIFAQPGDATAPKIDTAAGETSEQNTPAAVADDANIRAIDRALAIFLQRQFPTASAAQCRLASLVSRQLAAGHICLPIATRAQCAAIENYCGASILELLETNPLVGATASTPLVRDQSRLYLCRYWRLETAIATHIEARLATPLFTASMVSDLLDTLFPSAGDAPNWQQLACLLAGHKRFGIITGGPGTGKTTTVVRLLALLQQLGLDHDGRPLRIRLAAPTGKAASRLNDSITGAIDRLPISQTVRDALPHEVTTLHRLLGFQAGSRHFRHHRHNRLRADLVVIDEASMIDIDQTLQLFEALPDHCRLILVGDKDQLASVEAGAVMADLCAQADHPAYTATTRALISAATGTLLPAHDVATSALSQQIVKLQKNWRSKDAPGINQLAHAINRQDYTATEQAFIEHPNQLLRVTRNSGWINQQLIDPSQGPATLLHQMQQLRPASHADDDTIDAWAQQLLAQLGAQQLLTPLRHGPDGIDGLNAAIADTLYRRQLIPQRDQFAGMPLLVTKNLYDLDLMNGDLGLLLEHPRLGLRAAFATSAGIRWILPDQLETRSQMAFALSVHQSQGSEFARVLLYLPTSMSPLLTRELIYTAVTRASRQFVLLEGDTPLLSSAIQRRTQRHSGLADRLHRLGVAH